MADSSVAHAWKEADLTPSQNCITVFLTLGSWDRTSLLGMAILKGEITLKKKKSEYEALVYSMRAEKEGGESLCSTSARDFCVE